MKRTFSRRHRAGRSLAALFGLVLALQLLNVYNFAPSAALRDKERELGIEKTEEIARAQYTKTLEIVLSGRDDLLLVTEQRSDLFQGWQADNAWQLRRDPAQSVQIEANASGNERATYLWLCGWVADPEITELKLRIYLRQWYGTDDGNPDVELTVTEFQQWQGERVFLLASEKIPPTYTVQEIYLITEQGEQPLWRQ